MNFANNVKITFNFSKNLKNMYLIWKKGLMLNGEVTQN